MEEPRLENAHLHEAYDDAGKAEEYRAKHAAGVRKRVAHRSEVATARRALLAGGTGGRVLDCPAGTGRFWPLLSELFDEIHAVDPSMTMLDVAGRHHPEANVRARHIARAQQLPLADGAVDTVFCSRLIHHFPDSHFRREIFAEFARVATRSVVFSTWETRNYKWLYLLNRYGARGEERGQKRFCIPMADLHADLRAVGLTPVTAARKLRWISPLVFVTARVR